MPLLPIATMRPLVLTWVEQMSLLRQQVGKTRMAKSSRCTRFPTRNVNNTISLSVSNVYNRYSIACTKLHKLISPMCKSHRCTMDMTISRDYSLSPSVSITSLWWPQTKQLYWQTRHHASLWTADIVLKRYASLSSTPSCPLDTLIERSECLWYSKKMALH